MSACFCNDAERSPLVIHEDTLAAEELLLLLLLLPVVSVFLPFEQFDCTDNSPNNKKVPIKKFHRIVINNWSERLFTVWFQKSQRIAIPCQSQYLISLLIV